MLSLHCLLDYGLSSVVYLLLHINRFISTVCLQRPRVLKTSIKIAYSPPSSQYPALSKLNTVDAGRSQSMCGVIVVDAESFRSTILQSITFWSINQKYQKYLLYLLFSFIYLYQISLLQVSMKGLTTTLSRWVQVVWLFVHVLVICLLSPTGLIPWFSN